MTGIAVLRGGLLTTVQDGGRLGWQQHGVPVAGPMDAFALRAANLVVGNEPDEAALEVTLLGPELRFEEDADVAIVGADLSAVVQSRGATEAVRLNEPVRLASGAILRFGERKRLARAYVAVRGGLDVPAVLGSRSTSMPAGLPGLAGRPIRNGDALAIGRRASRSPGRIASLQWLDELRDPVVVRFLWGPDADLFAPRDKAMFVASPYTVSTSSNRMGYRLEGAPVRATGTGRLLSEATPIGSIQIPPSGEPILLMADRQTTGGYPRIGTVITADLSLAGQVAPGGRLAFSACTREHAIEALRGREDALLEIERWR